MDDPLTENPACFAPLAVPHYTLFSALPTISPFPA